MDETFPLGSEERGYVYRVVRRIITRPEDAEDVTQDALLRAHAHRDKFRGESHYRTWLYRIATTSALLFLRKRRRDRVRIAEEIGRFYERVASTEKPCDLRLADAELCVHAHRALADLKPKHREILLARVDATEPEVAARLGISLSNVKIRTHRARRDVRERLARLEVA